MCARGKFVVLEGIDGSGKRTQLDMLARALTSRGVPLTQVGFPNYEGFFGKMVARFLNGDFGPLQAVDAHFSALLYAGDRLESRPAIEAALSAGRVVLADRYVGSNLAHQGARVPPERRAAFLKWVKDLEYEIYGLPAEDFVLYLRLPVTEAHRLVGQKAVRGYTKMRRDIQEADVEHLEAASQVYDVFSEQPNWAKIECWDTSAQALRSPESIHEEIIATLGSRLFPALQAGHG
jgi:dTMP kinase